LTTQIHSQTGASSIADKDPQQEAPSGSSTEGPPTVEAQASDEGLALRQKGILSAAASKREILSRGRRAFDNGDDEAALTNLSRLSEYGIEYADVHYMIGILHERGGHFDDAVESLRKAIRLNPSYAEALLALASLHEMRGDFDLSEGYAERASQLTRPVSGQLDPTTRGKLANQQAALADALVEAGELRDAIDEFRRALDRCPNFHDIRHRLGITLRDAGLPFQAAKEFQRILSAHVGMLESQIQLGLTYYSLGRTPQAIHEWESVLERDPSRDEARMYLRLVRNSYQPTVTARDTMQWSKVALDAPADVSSADSPQVSRIIGGDA
jgi:tetratricopeptide (TPR) repeat protein